MQTSHSTSKTPPGAHIRKKKLENTSEVWSSLRTGYETFFKCVSLVFQICRISGKGEQITEARRMILDLIDSVMVRTRVPFPPLRCFVFFETLNIPCENTFSRGVAR